MAGVGVAEVGQEGRGDGLLAGLRGQHGAGETGEKRSLDQAKAAKLTKVRMESARKMFDAVDIDRSGLLEPLEFKRFMRKLDATLSSTDIQLALGMLDKDGDGVVSFAEFSGWWGSGEPQDVLADLRRAIQGAAADAAPFSLSEDDAKESLSQDLQADPTGKEMMAELKKDLDDAPPQVQFPKSEQPQALTAEQQAAKNKELERLYLFQQFDTDGSGDIDVEELIELASALGETWSEEQALIAMDQMDGDGSGSLDLEELRLWYTDFERGGGGMLGEALRKEGDRRFRRFARALLEVRQDGEMSVEVDAGLKAVQEARSDPVSEPASWLLATGFLLALLLAFCLPSILLADLLVLLSSLHLTALCVRMQREWLPARRGRESDQPLRGGGHPHGCARPVLLR